MGELAEFQRVHGQDWVNKIPGIGKAKAKDIQDAWDAFWVSRRAESIAQAPRVAEAMGMPKSEAEVKAEFLKAPIGEVLFEFLPPAAATVEVRVRTI